MTRPIWTTPRRSTCHRPEPLRQRGDQVAGNGAIRIQVRVEDGEIEAEGSSSAQCRLQYRDQLVEVEPVVGQLVPFSTALGR